MAFLNLLAIYVFQRVITVVADAVGKPITCFIFFADNETGDLKSLADLLFQYLRHLPAVRLSSPIVECSDI
jgi:hypothetical protein